MGISRSEMEMMKEKKRVERLIDSLKDGDTQVREGAAKALGEIGDARAVEPLIRGFPF